MMDCTQMIMTVIIQLQYSHIKVLKDQWLINKCTSVIKGVMVIHIL